MISTTNASLRPHARGNTADSAMLILSAAVDAGRSGWLYLSGERLALSGGQVVFATKGMATKLARISGLTCWAWRRTIGAPEGDREPTSLIAFLCPAVKGDAAPDMSALDAMFSEETN